MIYVRTYYTWKKIVFSSLARAFKDQVLRRSFLYYTHTCRLPAGTTAAIVVCTADRTRYTHTTYNGRTGAHTTAPLTICFVPTISVLIYLLVEYIYQILFWFYWRRRISRFKVDGKKLKPPPWEPHRRRRAADLFFEFFRSTKRAYIHTVPRYVCS